MQFDLEASILQVLSELRAVEFPVLVFIAKEQLPVPSVENR